MQSPKNIEINTKRKIGIEIVLPKRHLSHQDTAPTAPVPIKAIFVGLTAVSAIGLGVGCGTVIYQRYSANAALVSQILSEQISMQNSVSNYYQKYGYCPSVTEYKQAQHESVIISYTSTCDANIVFNTNIAESIPPLGGKSLKLRATVAQSNSLHWVCDTSQDGSVPKAYIPANCTADASKESVSPISYEAGFKAAQIAAETEKKKLAEIEAQQEAAQKLEEEQERALLESMETQVINQATNTTEANPATNMPSEQFAYHEQTTSIPIATSPAVIESSAIEKILSGARSCFKKQQYDCAKSKAEAALEIDPKNAEAKRLMANSEAEQKKAFESDWDAR